MLNIQKNILLAPYTTFKIGGPAKYFSEAKNIEEIQELCKWVKNKNIPVFVLGGGSNVLISDKGFDGLVIKIRNSKSKIKSEEVGLPIGSPTSKIETDAGVPLAKLVIESANAGLSGLEWAIGIPGTVGGAISGNAGAYGHSISESVDKVKTMSINDLSFRDYSRKECGFIYRGSNFSAKGGSASGGKNTSNEIIIAVELELSPEDKNKIQKTIKDTVSQRKTKIPPLPSAGSFFKNYKLPDDYKDSALIKKFPELAEKIRSGKIATGYLIGQCGLKGIKVGGAMIANEHTNFIVNAGGATAQDVLTLAEMCKKKVKEKYGLHLEIEKRLIGFD